MSDALSEAFLGALIAADVFFFIGLCCYQRVCLDRVRRPGPVQSAQVELANINELGEDARKVTVVACPI